MKLQFILTVVCEAEFISIPVNNTMIAPSKSLVFSKLLSVQHLEALPPLIEAESEKYVGVQKEGYVATKVMSSSSCQVFDSYPSKETWY